ncbi:MAG: response regulator [Phycisphaeraceae bacterium]|nr:response regulator [Phycisphaeraceae bacterium]
MSPEELKTQAVDVLLVEDNPNDAELTLRALNKNNFINKIYHVKDGAEALEFVFATGQYSERTVEHLPKVMLLDLKLPKVSGIEVLRKLKADDRTKTIPVVVLTSSKQDQDLIDTYDLGVNSYIVKPVEFETFLDAVAEVGLYWMMLNESPQKF